MVYEVCTFRDWSMKLRSTRVYIRRSISKNTGFSEVRYFEGDSFFKTQIHLVRVHMNMEVIGSTYYSIHSSR